MGSVVLFVLMPYFLDIDSDVLSTTKSAETEKGILYILTLVGGFILLAISVLNVIQRVCSSTNQNSLMIPGMVRLESKVKRAASYKMKGRIIPGVEKNLHGSNFRRRWDLVFNTSACG